MSMRRSLTSAELKVMTPSQRDARMSELVASTKRTPNGEISEFDARIKLLEEKHDMSSDEMRSRVAAGSMVESDEICAWLMALNLRERLARLGARSR